MTGQGIVERLAGLLKTSAELGHSATHQRKYTFVDCPHPTCVAVKEALADAEEAPQENQ